MISNAKISPMLWFDGQAEEAARFYVSIFPHSKVGRVSRFPNVGQEVHGRAAGSVMVVEFELEGQAFSALNGGPQFTFNEAISLVVSCETQAELDRYWAALGEGGDPKARQCGWLKDRFGVSWQVVPTALTALVSDPDPAKAARAFAAMMEMKKLDVAALERAHRGG